MAQKKPEKPVYRRLWFRLAVLCVAPGFAVMLAIAVFVGWNYGRLPEVAELKNIEFIEPLKIFTRDGKLISEIGEIKRTPVDFADIPLKLQQAFMAAEDARFYHHVGIDFFSMARAISQYISDSDQQTGASTITMQLARGFYLSNERTLWRKFREILLATKIERELPKEKIFELYLNKIFLGHKSYGVSAAALTYYNARLADLTLAQMAAIAALPKAPSTLNPISNPQRNLERRNWIIGRMQELGYIDDIEATIALKEPIDATPYKVEAHIPAGYVAENVRLQLLEPGVLTEQGVTPQFLYNNGIRVYTSIDSGLQQAADKSSFLGLMQYEERHGFKGPIKHFDLFDNQNPDNANSDGYSQPDVAKIRQNHPQLDDALEEIKNITSYSKRLTAALVVGVTDNTADLLTAKGELLSLDFADHFPFQGVFVSTNKVRKAGNFAKLLQPGDAVYIRRQNTPTDNDKSQKPQWLLAQAPSAQTALISLDPSDGSVLAMVGGADFSSSQFNRATQAERLIGSNIKPIIYSYGFEQGLSPGSVLIDGPIGNSDGWRPQNSGLSFLGPITLRRALALSRNLVSIRLLSEIGVNPTATFIEKLGITSKPPRDLSLALGTASFSPQNATRGMSMFVNGGHLIEAQLIDTVYNNSNTLLYARPSLGVCMQSIVFPYGSSQAVQAGNAPLADLAGLDTTAADARLATEPPIQQQTDGQRTPDQQKVVAGITLAQNEDSGLFDQTWRDRYCAENQAAPPRPLSRTSSYLIHNIMRDVINYGTATKAKRLKRSDYAGKTGTTNDTIDAWFTGLHPMIVTTVWVGFDKPATLGVYESGSRAALPTWIDYMQHIQDRIPEVKLQRPEAVVSAYIDPTTGDRVRSHFPGAVRELFTESSMPAFTSKILLPSTTGHNNSDKPGVLTRPEDIF